MAEKIQTVFIKVNKNLEMIERILTAALDAGFAINGQETMEEYIRSCGQKMLYLSFDWEGPYINFNQFELNGDEKVLKEEELLKWLSAVLK